MRRGTHWALRDVSLTLRSGEHWLLTGRNGSGKTMLMKLLRGDVWPTPTGREQRLYRLDDETHRQPLAARERIAYLGPEVPGQVRALRVEPARRRCRGDGAH